MEYDLCIKSCPQSLQVRQLTSPEIFAEQCLGHAADRALHVMHVAPKQLCFITFLPHILDSGAAGREHYLQASHPPV